MTKAQVQDYLEKAKKIADEAVTSKKEAREFLVNAGICTKKGELKKVYR